MADEAKILGRAHMILEESLESSEREEAIEEILDGIQHEDDAEKRQELLEELDSLTYSTFLQNLEMAEEHAERKRGDDGELPPSAARNLDDLKEETFEFIRADKEEQEKIQRNLEAGKIDAFTAEVKGERLSEKRIKTSTRMGLESVGLDWDKLSDIAWEARGDNLILNAHEPEKYQKAIALREMLKKVPWHERDEVLEELAEKCGIDNDELDEIRQAIF
ncbi:MAG: hypothetical protein JRJ85_17650 [Deltaproteobacteria bacterium]|nr:hypothetical protein [Deltaproteobacteria bacterium]